MGQTSFQASIKAKSFGRVSPLAVEMRTASRRNPSMYLVAVLNLLHSKHCSKETGTKP